MFLTTLSTFTSALLSPLYGYPVSLQNQFPYSGTGPVNVPIQLGVMSRCPDALLCESVFNEVVPKVSDKIDLSLVYVGKFDPSDTEFGVSCMHGAQECAGNIQQLCVKKYTSFQQWWEFVQCQNHQGRYKVGEPALALSCASAVGFDWQSSGVGECAGSDASGRASEGIELLKESVKLGHDLNITKSCTVLISGQKVCVHDETWKECENGHSVGAFVRQIEEEYNRLNHLNGKVRGLLRA